MLADRITSSVQGNSSLTGDESPNDEVANEMFEYCHTNHINYCLWKLTYQNMDTVRDFYMFANIKDNNFTGGMMKDNNLTSYLLNFVELLAYLTHMYPNLAPKKIIDLVATKEDLKRKRK